MNRDNPFLWSHPSDRPIPLRGIPVYSPEPQAPQPRPSVRPSTFRGIPVHSPGEQVQHSKKPVEMPVKKTSTAPKVVQIPVRFVGSEPSPSASALKIQKVFRGFLVRRSMKRIIAIRRDVDEIERRISTSETLELIRKDERERLRLNEMLMALLFKLDSVRGVDSGVRDCRRAVIKKAIALQERVDAIVSAVDQSEIQILGESTDNGKDNTEAVVQTLETTVTVENSVQFGNQIEESAVGNFEHGHQESSEVKDAGKRDLLEDVPKSENPVVDKCGRAEVGRDLEMNAEEENRAQEAVDGTWEVEDSGVHSEMKVEDENCIKHEVIDNDNVVNVEADLGTRVKDEERCVEKELPEESVETSQMETLTEGGEVNDVSLKRVEEMREEEKERTDVNKRNRELLKRMMEDNEKMMSLMSQLCERNETQTGMLNALAQRVEQLEKAFVCHRLRKKKGRHSA